MTTSHTFNISESATGLVKLAVVVSLWIVD
jgi:hypothetical protein